MLDISVDYKSPIPVYEQIKQAVKLKIISGIYQKDDRIVSIRELSDELKVNQNTILKAYYQLDVEGYIYSKPGQGYFVKDIKESRNKKNEEVFKILTCEYLNKALSLSYSIEDIINEIKKGGKMDGNN
ncbi:MAG: GntR family transcriptional regulator [Spirochaetes bacterium]|nr:GntR family transcriptional regulator [Spirochaetota bacterium]